MNNCEGNFYQGTACHKCERCIVNRCRIVSHVLTAVDPNDAFDIWVADKPSYYGEEHRKSFIAAWAISREGK